jgi:hypothetical protein
MYAQFGVTETDSFQFVLKQYQHIRMSSWENSTSNEMILQNGTHELVIPEKNNYSVAPVSYEMQNEACYFDNNCISIEISYNNQAIRGLQNDFEYSEVEYFQTTDWDSFRDSYFDLSQNFQSEEGHVWRGGNETRTLFETSDEIGYFSERIEWQRGPGVTRTYSQIYLERRYSKPDGVLNFYRREYKWNSTEMVLVGFTEPRSLVQEYENFTDIEEIHREGYVHLGYPDSSAFNFEELQSSILSFRYLPHILVLGATIIVINFFRRRASRKIVSDETYPKIEH